MPALSALTTADIAEVMRIERLPGYDALVGAFTADEHAAELASPDAIYLGFREGGGLAGFVILQAFREPVVLLRRIAVAQTGRGTGTTLFAAAVDWYDQAQRLGSKNRDIGEGIARIDRNRRALAGWDARKRLMGVR